MKRVGWFGEVAGWLVVYRKDFDKLMDHRKKGNHARGTGWICMLWTNTFFYSGVYFAECMHSGMETEPESEPGGGFLVILMLNSWQY